MVPSTVCLQGQAWLWTSVSIEHHQSSQTQSLRVSSELMVGVGGPCQS